MRIATYIPSQIEFDIQALKPGDYRQGIEEFLDAFRSRFKAKAAIYQFGKVRSPGISDLDLLLVVEADKWHSATTCAQQVSQSTPKLAYMFVHPPLVICDSLVESLPYLHTLENLEPVTQKWHPLEKISPQEIDKNSRLMRHAVWNSFMRMAALEMDGRPIGLRRALILAHNLYLTAIHGNNLLDDPVEINFDSIAMRRRAMETPPEELQAFIKEAITQIVEALNAVDQRLDAQLRCTDDLRNLHKWVLSLRGRFIIPAWCADAALEGGGTRLLKSLRLVLSPGYSLSLGALISHRVGDYAPQLSPFKQLPLPECMAKQIPPTAYEAHLRRAIRLAREHKVNFPFVLPFSARAHHPGLRGFLLSRLRRHALACRLAEKALPSALPLRH